MTHNILIQRMVGAKNVSIWNRSAVHATEAFDNGNLLSLGGISATAGEGEVFSAAVPATATLADLWMVYTPEVVLTIDGTKVFKGINVDPQDFYVPALTVMDVFKPQKNDILTLTADGLAGVKGANTYVVATDGSKLLTWAAAPISGMSLQLIGDDYISLPNGGINPQRVVAYKFQVVVN